MQQELGGILILKMFEVQFWLYIHLRNFRFV